MPSEEGPGGRIENERTTHNGLLTSLTLRLAEVDLSHYFWLVRNRLGLSLFALSLTLPSLRQAGLIMDGLLEDEVDLLASLPAKQIQRAPKDKVGFDAFLKLAKLRPLLGSNAEAA